jgi:hypothetical protein
MKRVGVAVLPLHYGRVPRWLFGKMVRLSASIASLVVNEYGRKELLRRLADPFWFQALGNVLGFDWHSSGLTTTTMGALKQGLKQTELGIGVAGGKGLTSRKTPEDIKRIGEGFGFPSKKVEKLLLSSRLSAKVDNAVLQDSYQLYHHTFIISEEGDWVVVQQGMNPLSRTARRYHWISTELESFVDEPHAGIITDVKHKKVIDLTSSKSKETRRCSVDLAKEDPRKLFRQLNSLRVDYNNSLLRFLKGFRPPEREVQQKLLMMPKQINWKALERAMELKPRDYEELLGIRGLGPATLRALALVSHLVHGSELSWRDPCKYSFAHGGKDGIPHPIRPQIYSKTIEILEDAIKQASIGRDERLRALKRLRSFLKM